MQTSPPSVHDRAVDVAGSTSAAPAQATTSSDRERLRTVERVMPVPPVSAPRTPQSAVRADCRNTTGPRQFVHFGHVSKGPAVTSGSKTASGAGRDAREHLERGLAHGQLVELRIDAAEVVRAVVVARV